MKKKIIVGLVCILMIGTIGISAKGFSDIISFEKKSKFEKVVNKIEDTAETDAEFNDIMYECKYLELGIEAPNEHIDYIYDLILNGYDSETIIDLYYFWLDTNEDISIIEKMYDLREKYDGFKYWKENAYEEITDNQHGSLGTEEVEEYIAKGLSVSEIELADKLCRKGVYRIEEILDKKLEGISLAEIVCDTYGCKLAPEVISYISKNEENEEKIENRLETAIKLSRISGEKIENLLKLASEDVDIESIYVEEQEKKAIEVFKELCEENLYKLDDKVKENAELYDKIKSGDINGKEILDMLKNGYSELDILNKLGDDEIVEYVSEEEVFEEEVLKSEVPSTEPVSEETANNAVKETSENE